MVHLTTLTTSTPYATAFWTAPPTPGVIFSPLYTTITPFVLTSHEMSKIYLSSPTVPWTTMTGGVIGATDVNGAFTGQVYTIQFDIYTETFFNIQSLGSTDYRYALYQFWPPTPTATLYPSTTITDYVHTIELTHTYTAFVDHYTCLGPGTNGIGGWCDPMLGTTSLTQITGISALYLQPQFAVTTMYDKTTIIRQVTGVSESSEGSGELAPGFIALIVIIVVTALSGFLFLWLIVLPRERRREALRQRLRKSFKEKNAPYEEVDTGLPVTLYAWRRIRSNEGLHFIHNVVPPNMKNHKDPWRDKYKNASRVMYLWFTLRPPCYMAIREAHNTPKILKPDYLGYQVAVDYYDRRWDSFSLNYHLCYLEMGVYTTTGTTPYATIYWTATPTPGLGVSPLYATYSVPQSYKDTHGSLLSNRPDQETGSWEALTAALIGPTDVNGAFTGNVDTILYKPNTQPEDALNYEKTYFNYRLFDFWPQTGIATTSQDYRGTINTLTIDHISCDIYLDCQKMVGSTLFNPLNDPSPVQIQPVLTIYDVGISLEYTQTTSHSVQVPPWVIGIITIASVAALTGFLFLCMVVLPRERRRTAMRERLRRSIKEKNAPYEEGNDRLPEYSA
ncbi:hypothetical protein DL96DRAFT_1687112 [Flagelloscypha sp. PMI_526]|nr:hypothetical protein DL96DRAFT_1687112 [Flagelloscypha sp. PMI_526]